MTPYRAQIQLLGEVLRRTVGASWAEEVEINTVDKYQGRDKACIVVSLVRSNEDGAVGQLLQDRRRINVALTRAKSKLVLLGSRTTLAASPVLEELLGIVGRNDWIV